MKRFAEWEKDLILLAYPTTQAKDIAAFLGRSTGTIHAFVSKSGISTPGKTSPENAGLSPKERAIQNDRRAREKKRSLGKCSDCTSLAELGSVFCNACKEKRRVKTHEERRLLKAMHKCLDCRKDVDNQIHARCDSCLAKHMHVNNAAYHERKLSKICVMCGKEAPAQGILNCKCCGKRKKVEESKVRKQLKDAAYAAYGGYRCNCCGESNPLFLAIDHINGDGARHRKLLGSDKNPASTRRIYQWLRRMNYPAGFQVLCHNCNHGKHLNGNVCPHNEDGGNSSVLWLWKLSS